MALTKISTGGVKDDAASQAKIADEAVDEARLQISNAGTNGQFLSKQSGNTGGLTWATVDTNLSSDTSPQLGGDLDVNSKNIEFGDSAGATDDRLTFGVGAGGVPDLSIYSNGTEGILETQDGGTIRIKDGSNTMASFSGASNQLDIGVHTTFAGQTSNAYWDKANNTFGVPIVNVTSRIHISGSAGTSGQVFTSGGSGAAPSWTTINASPSVTANADGAIGAGDSVLMQANGTVKKIQATTVVNNPPVKQINSSQDSIQNTVANAVSMAYWPDESAFVMMYKPDSNNSLYAQAGKVTSTGAITFGNSRSGNLYSANNNDAVIKHASGDTFVFTFRDSSNQVYIRAITVTRNSDTSYNYTTGSATLLFGTGSELSLAKVDSAGNYFLVVSKDYANSSRSSSRMVYRSGTSLTAGTVQYGSDSFSRSNSLPGQKPYVLYDSTSGKAVVYADAGGSGQTVYYCVGTPSYSTSNPTMSWGSTGNVKGSDNNNIKAERKVGYHDTVQNRIVFMCPDENSNRLPTILSGTLSGTTITWGARTQLSTSSGGVYMITSAYDSTNGVGLIQVRDGNSNNGDNFVSAITVNSSNAVTATNLLLTENNSYPNRHGATFDSTNKLILLSFRGGGNNRATVLGVKLASTSTTAENLLGFNQSAVTDGNAATIDLVGATNENQSSLTVGAKYYVQKNGTIATTADTPSVVAGTAVAATKLVVKG